jgi:NADPH:quinone reductase-like Zn-dependent oxidoreductase
MVFTKLGQPLPLGYCNVGKIYAVGQNVTEFAVGDRVASNGNHAENVIKTISPDIKSISVTDTIVDTSIEISSL